jgi:uncharacterized protein YlxP (DUF503 family)
MRGQDMYILYGSTDLFFPYSESLKEKRKTVQSIMPGLENDLTFPYARLTITICGSVSLGFSAVCNTYSDAELLLNSIKNTLELHADISEMTMFKHQIQNYDQSII